MAKRRSVRFGRAVSRVLGKVRQSLLEDTGVAPRQSAFMEQLENRLLLSSTFKYYIGWGYWCPQYYTYQGGSCIPCETAGQQAQSSADAQAAANNAAAQTFENDEMAADDADVEGPVAYTQPVQITSNDSQAPIEYATGNPVNFTTDLSSDGYGSEWGQSRTWDTAVDTGPLGPGWNITQWSHLENVNAVYGSEDPDAPSGATKTVAVVNGTGNLIWFDSFNASGPYSYTERSSGDDKLVDDGTYFTLYDSSGGQTKFFDFNNANLGGQLVSYADAGGNTTTATYSGSPSYDLLTVTRSNGNQAEKWSYAYTTLSYGGTSQDVLTSVTQSQSTDGGSTYSTVESVAYTYYGGSNLGGDAGFLQTATTKDASGNPIDTWAYRYYTSGSSTPGDLKMVFNPQDYDTVRAAGIDPTAASTTDAEVASYATNYYQYSSQHVVSWEAAQGAGCSCSTSNGQGVFQYSYWTSNAVQTAPYSYNVWQNQTTVYLPDGNQEVVFTNAQAEPMMDITQQLSVTTPMTGVTQDPSGTYAGDWKLATTASFKVGDVAVVRGWDGTYDTFQVLNVGSTYIEVADYGGFASTASGMTVQKLQGQSAYYYRYYDNNVRNTADTNVGSLEMAADPSAVNIPLNFTAVTQTSLSNPFPALSYNDLVHFSNSTGLAAYLNTASGLIDVDTYYFGDPSIGWTFSGPAGISGNNSAMTSTLSAQAGNQAAFVQQNGSLSQSLNFTATGTYTLGFYAAQRENVTGTNEQLQVELDGVAVGSAFTPGSSYASHSQTLTISSIGIHTITIVGSYGVSGSGALIDNVTLTGTSAPSLNDASFETPALNNVPNGAPTGVYVYDPGEATATSTTAGGAAGYLHDEFQQQGQLGAAQTQETEAYYAHPIPGTTLSLNPLATSTTYSGADGSGAITQTMTYTWLGNEQEQSVTTTEPVVSAADNGSGTAITSTQVYDVYGRVIYSIDGDGYVTQTAYDNATGAVVKSVTDASPYAATILADGPLSYWRLDESSGTTAYDLSGNGNNGTYGSGTTLGTTGALSNDSDTAATLAGGTGTTGNIAIPTFTFTGDFAVEAWTKFSSMPTNTSSLVGVGPGTNDINFYAGYIRLYDGVDVADSSVQVTTGQWEHYVVTRTGSTVSIYRDGALVGTGTSSATFTISKIGWGLQNGNFGGSVDELALYQHALTAAQVAAHYAAGSGSHLNLTTTTVPDDLGRPHEITDPDGNVTIYTYNDANHESRIYPGYGIGGEATQNSSNTTTLTDSLQLNSSGSYVGDLLTIVGGTDAGESETVSAYNSGTHTLTLSSAFTSDIDTTSHYVLSPETTTGPITVVREYRPAASAPLGQQTVYDEYMTELPTGSIHIGSDGLPDGGEAIGTIYSLSRNLLSNGDQVVETDDYTDLTGITYSTANAYLASPFRIDGTTASAWSPTYGSGWNEVAGYSASSTPAYLSAAPSMPSTGTWSTTAASPLLYRPGSGSLFSNNYWTSGSGTNFTFNLDFTDAPTLHQVALYLIDYDKLGLMERVDVTDVSTGNLLDSRVISNFSQGEYLVYANLSGNIKFTFTNLTGSTGTPAELSGLFIDAGAATNYNATKFWYDASGNLARTQDPNGTITRQVFDAYGQPISEWIGTNDIPTSGWWSPTNNNGDSNMTDVEDMSYDIQSAPPEVALTAGTHSFGSTQDTYIRITYVVEDSGMTTYETAPSLEMIFVNSNNVIVASPPPPTNIAGTIIGYNVYASGNPGTYAPETLQNSSPIGIGTPWTEPITGLVSGAAMPAATGAGDGLLMRVVQHSLNYYDGTNEDQVTEQMYDWHDRPVLSDMTGQGSDRLPGMELPVYYNVYNNLNQVVESDQYSETGTYNFSIANLGQTNGMPNSPAAGLLVAKETMSFDYLGNEYLSQTYSVDPSTGAVGPALSTNYFYDNRGNLVEEADAGGQVTQSVYDGAGRLVKQSITDGGAMGGAPLSWANAGSTANDVVLEQTLYTYDNDGNVILTEDRQRFDDDPTSAVGDLAGPSGGTLASRDYFSTNYYDAAGRLTDSVNVGTNNGSAYTRSSSVPSSSATVLVSHTDYNSAGEVKDQIDPSGNKTGYLYDMLGEQTEVISDWDGTSSPTPGSTMNQIVKYTYDGNGNVFSMTAVQPSGGSTPNQTTEYEYAATYPVHNNDLLTAVDYPDKTTGLPSTSNQDTYTYDALQHVWRSSDRNGNVHWYLHDVTGRLTADILLTLGSGVNGTIRRLEYSFTGLGLPYQQTSYTSAFGSTVANQVTDSYNGFGQLISEVQNHGGGTSGTVYYNYSDTVGPQGQYVNNSNLTSMEDPDGRVLDYLYGGTSAVSSITHSGTTATVTTTSPTGLGIGQQVTIQGASQSAYDGTFAITSVVDATHFTYTMLTTPGSNASGTDMTAVGSPEIALSSITFSGTTATGTSVNALGMTTGTIFQISIQGATDPLYDGTFNATVTGTNTFTYTMTSTPAANASGADLVGVNPVQMALSSITYSSGLATGTSSTSLGLTTGSQFTFTISGASPSAYNGTFTATVTGSTTFTYKPLSAPGSSASGTHMIVGLNLPSLDGAISRVTAIADHTDANVLESYNYLGAGTVIQQNRPEPGVDLTYVQQNSDTLYSSDGGDRYTGLDRFGRIIDQFWTNTDTPSSPTDRLQYGYDEDGNVLFSNNLVSSTNSELYTYDADDRLTSFERGTLNSGHTAITGTPSVNESWNLDALGNWTGGSQSRTFNADNQITAITGTTNTPNYDNNGNMTGDQNAYGYTYDGWNRMVSANNGSVTKEYVYDADGRLISTSFMCGGPISNSYYSSSWQDVEDDNVSGGVTTKNTYVWGMANTDELISRDATVSGVTTRIFAEQNPNLSVISLLSSSGSVLQRFQYDVYGSATVLTAAWGSTTDAYSWVWRFQAGKYDTTSGLEKFRNRDYNTFLGVWTEEDPLGYAGSGPNVYNAFDSNPTTMRDPSGTDVNSALGPPPQDAGPVVGSPGTGAPSTGGRPGTGAPGTGTAKKPDLIGDPTKDPVWNRGGHLAAGLDDGVEAGGALLGDGIGQIVCIIPNGGFQLINWAFGLKGNQALPNLNKELHGAMKGFIKHTGHDFVHHVKGVIHGPNLPPDDEK